MDASNALKTNGGRVAGPPGMRAARRSLTARKEEHVELALTLLVVVLSKHLTGVGRDGSYHAKAVASRGSTPPPEVAAMIELRQPGYAPTAQLLFVRRRSPCSQSGAAWVPRGSRGASVVLDSVG